MKFIGKRPVRCRIIFVWRTLGPSVALNNALVAVLPDSDELLRRLNASLVHDLPKSLRKRPQILAIDETLVPYHGQPWQDENEIRRGKPKSGTSHFHPSNGERWSRSFIPC